ncbi:hypothetical protein BABINDRAFT_160943 [Babjeviella inositovora NRRL Y-12698]|uniref:Cytochrome c oxidase assembly protein CtaG/Cox11 n=1 Tax=Babjeviella inositovora NRRL Y-12698 TaxID=984486 RepID=A0A1E3QUT9_9ASCO|nr:uncharacterized protein BABINDRAFT_160943 [Babjeviella inositovora NRRL Y-12698]ODQ80717.1 hypothetical protein BABINDRAFT_160943 [Babjeviella inositovora NRRL Y-12698]
MFGLRAAPRAFRAFKPILLTPLRSFRLSHHALGELTAAPKKRLTGFQEHQLKHNLSNDEMATLYREYREEKTRKRNLTIGLYFSSIAVVTLALGYASVPLYRLICQRTGWGGTPITDQTKFTPDKFVPVDLDHKIRISFTTQTSGILPWKFTPQQREVYLTPGETALAFYKAKNYSDKDIIGMATYSVTPDHVAPYFNKIQCFCFEEQRLLAGEEVDMPVFFFIDPEFASDPAMRNIDDVVLHYTFFKARYDDDGELTPEVSA